MAKLPDKRDYDQREFKTAFAARVYLISDEDIAFLFERAVPGGDSTPSRDYAPDPLGLAYPNQWRLPAFSLNRPLTEDEEAMEVAWDIAYKKTCITEASYYHETLLVPSVKATDEHPILSWVELRARCYVAWRPDELPLKPAPGIERRFFTMDELMSDAHNVSSHSRYVFLRLNEFMSLHGSYIY
ncbi:hypothetical protein [Kordiimonas sp.]|uniref:hypothetical protein n=1 Tax=Kordiimonas sp. TaxID=1970157 RepID=UPI003A8FCCDF